METILHFFYKITNERGMKTVFTYAHVKWFYGQSERAYYLNYFINHFIYQLVDGYPCKNFFQFFRIPLANSAGLCWGGCLVQFVVTPPSW